MSRLTLLSVLMFLVVGSGVAAVYSKHLSRSLFVELQALQRAQDEIQIEWGQLQLEQSTWSTHDRISSISTERLDLYNPPGDEVVLVSPR